ncbi:hypothetical protein COU87_01750 [Candidatus Roizmanbacteria bacterium CG10_big_fil_rev_8_21_14_0_10_39_12]|uniref:Uncharacterized protein n=1 Tax=Candidatus Roizmanbacteria bacterium CG10_big_fil_rev_8_21_14_0_10_39_12 TaxID=1974852 RepID=A0A2M8KPZ3_9BACT|nr:MAG: hypothetical protein COU87_01750 [Candidatus Roizmanbacteria bacterium CG10_big_fil_rev_8_21_14_0_10_39_12]
MTDPIGLITCARYALPPNHLQYCGPPKSEEIGAYLQESASDEKLSEMLSQFETLYPYLTYIARGNGITDPYDPRVVEAYWIGNSLLKKLSQKSLYTHFSESLSLKKRLTNKELEWLIGKIPKGALAHHTFHVLNVITRTGHHSIQHTIETMDSCRIGWGALQKIAMGKVQLLTSELIYSNGKLILSKPILKQFDISHGMVIKSDDIGSTYTYHWGTLCAQITSSQLDNLTKVTNSAIRLANLTI